MSWGVIKGGMQAAALLPLCVLIPAESAPAVQPASLLASGAPAALVKGYGLGVVAVPPPLEVPLSAETTSPGRCPVEVRAVVVAEPASESFAILAWGDDSAVMQRGDSRRTPFGWLRVSSIHPQRVELRRGDVTFHCVLGGDAGTRSSGR